MKLRLASRAGRAASAGVLVACGALASTALGASSTHGSAAPSYTCNGDIIKLFDNTNPITLLNGGKSPSFSTGGKAYCVTSIETYHWNNGKGEPAGKLGLAGSSSVAPIQAKGNAGQGSVANASWTATFSTQSDPQVIDGTYVCEDSDPSTWSQNQQSGGKGMCIVYAVPAQQVSTGSTSTTGTTPTGTTPQCRSLSSTTRSSCDFNVTTKVSVSVTLKPADGSVRKTYPKAVEFVFSNDGKTAININIFAIAVFNDDQFTECGPVCQTSLPGHPALNWCELAGRHLICGRSRLFPSVLLAGQSVTLTILDHKGDHLDTKELLADWSPANGQDYNIPITGSA